MSPKLAGAGVAGVLTLLLSVTRHAFPIANHLQLTRDIALQEMALFARLVGIGSFVLLFVLPFGAGYVIGSRVDFATEYASIAVALGLGGGLGYLVGTGVIVPVTTITPGVFTTVAFLVGGAVGVAIEVAVVGFAGGALAYLQSGGRPAARPA